ncbi:MAG: hypothetical protein OW721_00595 [Buchnera aphidicola (Macrosiphum albifrons)]|uniref:Uncharacterized protein n=1 Tax=Buchnera aphidicola (Macrosiphum albifrons) TaxID=2994844 RepID=A0AAJ5PTE3_9GAMM|nr:MAG: hypothetical protein OW721_00595 [Buchnera aphidicola (Macrosiphum albifrons)]
MKIFKEILKNAFLMSMFSILFIFGTMLVNNITKNKIICQKEKEKKKY